MVKHQLQYFICFCISLVISNFNLAFASNMQPELILFVDKSESILGRPIRAELYGIALNTKISDIKLENLNNDFGVEVDYAIHDTSDKRWPNRSIQILKLKLYPRRAGKLLIPPLRYTNITSKEINIQIKSDGTSIPKIDISTMSPYERQQIIVHVSIESNKSTSRLSVKKDLDMKGVVINPLPFIREKNGKGTNILRIGWAITPLKSGALLLNFPPIEYSVSGVSRKKFYLPYKNLNIVKLPKYLPPTMAVGNIKIKSHLPSKWIMQADDIAYWNIELSGNVNNAYRLPAILRQLKSNDNITFFPADIKRDKEVKVNSYLSTVKYSIPFKISTSGFVNFPEIKFQYYDPTNEKIDTMVHKTNRIFVLSFFWRASISLVLLTAFSLLLQTIYNKSLKLINSMQKRKQALILLTNSKNSEEIKESMKCLASSESWPSNITLGQWATFWKAKYKTESYFEGLVDELSLFFYRSGESDIKNDLNLKIIELVKNRKRRKLFFTI